MHISKMHISLIKNDFMGVYCYDGSLTVPFEYYCVKILDGVEERILVQKYKDSMFTAYK